MKGMKIVVLLFVSSIVLFSCVRKEPETISVNKLNLFPEGIAYDGVSKQFYLSSLRFGTISKVSDQGQIQDFIVSDKLISTIGIRINPAGDRLYVCNSNPGVSVNKDKRPMRKVADLGIYSLPQGKEIAFIDLAVLDKDSMHFCNDITFDDKGNTYITDSFAGILYKVDTNGKPSILVKDEDFLVEGFQLNGLVFHKDGYLLVAHYAFGLLYKVTLSDPAKFSQVKLDEKLMGADGLAWLNNGNLSVIANANTNQIYEISTSKGWTEGKIQSKKSTGPVFATTGTKRGTEYYYLQAKLDKLFGDKLPVNTFEIVKYRK